MFIYIHKFHFGGLECHIGAFLELKKGVCDGAKVLVESKVSVLKGKKNVGVCVYKINAFLCTSCK